jgi:tetratricopeptide (TPR) repeat protein
LRASNIPQSKGHGMIGLRNYGNGSVPRRPSAAEQANAEVARATALAQEGRRQQAIALFRDVLSLCPDHAGAHYNLGVALAEEKRHAEALASLREALRCQPACAEAHCALGNVLGELERHEEAAAAFREAIRHNPVYVDALHNLGVALTRLQRSAEAAVLIRQAIRLRPDFAAAYNSLGLTHSERGEFAAAEACYEQALRLNPRSIDAHTNLGSAFKEQGRLEEAVVCYDLALALDPDDVTTHWNRSLAWLQMGDFLQGWPEYEWRSKRKGTSPPPSPHPPWDGSPLRGRTILLYAEQGLGDMLQFIRYAPMVKDQGGVVIVAAPLPVVGLLATCQGVDQTVTENQALPLFDVNAPFVSLPRLLKTTLATIPANVPYLTADPAKVESWRERLAGFTGFKVGIAWQGNPRHKWDNYRSFPLALMKPLAQVDGVTLVSLQKGSAAEQIDQVKDRFRVVNLGAELADFTDTAALMKCLDLVICCDTSVAHLAGALGMPVWVALSTIVDWRWLRDRVDSPWYPTMRLFQQKRLRKWKPVFRRMAKELATLAVRP